MKTIILTPKAGYGDLINYGKDLLKQMQKDFEVKIYDTIKSDFSNIRELFDDSEKLVLFDQFSISDGFKQLTDHLSSFKKIKFLLSPYSNYKGLDLGLLKKLNIHYRNNAGANAKSVAQYDITAMFMLLSKFPIFTKKMIMPKGTILGEEYHKKTAGIIGMGNVGKELLNILNGLNINTVYYNRSKENVNAKQVSLEEIFNQDIVFISIATNNETIKLLENLPSLIQEKSYIIDGTAVDQLYDKKKVVDLLNQNKFKGYAVEIFDPENFILKSDGNFIATPHIAWCTSDAERKTVEDYLNRALMILRGESKKIDFIV
jgi:lactate dehydrogenase-like 2-hydroxyacid dehydrogenase